MACRFRLCNDNEITGFLYCGEHLCTKIVKENIRCKRPKIKNSPFCWTHHYFVNKSSTFFNTIIILSFLFSLYGIYMLPPIQNYLHGKLIIDFKENDIILNELGKPSVKIEVLNKLGKPLLQVNGTATLACENLNQQITTKIFRLLGGHDVLGDGGIAEFLLSPDPFFVDLIKSKNYECSDAYLNYASYTKINKTYAKLKDIRLFDIFYNQNGDYNITERSYNNSEYITNYKCIKCNITIKIESSNNIPLYHKEPQLKFVGGSTKVAFFEKEIFLTADDNIAPNFAQILMGSYSESNYSKLCENVEKRYKLGLKCNEIIKGTAIPTPMFNDVKINDQACLIE